MKHHLQDLLQTALDKLLAEKGLTLESQPVIQLDRAKDRSHGDYATNLALVLAKACRLPPRQLAEQLIAALPASDQIAKIEFAGPGFINFFLSQQAAYQVVEKVIAEAERYGHCDLGAGQKLILEFVSANPTGPLHVGHGRGAAFGATLANLLKTAGYQVHSEYYVNDAGRQMNILAASVWLRYLHIAGQTVVFPANGYKGEYVKEIAQAFYNEVGPRYVHDWQAIQQDLPPDEPEGGDKELYIDALISRAKALLGEEGFKHCHQHGLNAVLDDIKEDLAEFGVTFEQWFSEQSLMSDGSIEKGVQALKDSGHCFMQEGALWFKSTEFGDEKDRVLIRANGQPTYFASDVAYHWNKYDRGFHQVVDIFGADHHGYFTRVKAAMNALGHDDSVLKVLFVQFAILYRGQERVQMSTRSGSFVTLRELREEVGNDAARFFYVSRKPEQHMDFDLDLAKSQSNDNPVYYIQYAHARICSVLRQLKERGLSWDQASGLTHLALLIEPQEKQLLDLLSRYPEVIESAAQNLEPHQLAYFLREMANGLHSYYNAVILLCEEPALRDARLVLLEAVRQVINNGLSILGVSAPETM